MEALKINIEENIDEQSINDGIDLKEMAEMKQLLINENKRLARETQILFKKVKEGTEIPKEENKAHSEAMKQLRRLETTYNSLLRLAKKQGIKEKDIEDEMNPNIDAIKNEPGSVGAIVRNLNNK